MPESMKLGLPVSLEVLGTIITTAATGYLILKKGWRPPFFYGIVIVSIGSVLSGIAWDGISFSVSRLITGIGYGFTWMSMRGYVSTYDSENVQNQGFSSLNSGIMSGLNCGVVLGAMIAERVGYQPVFIITVAFILISAAAAFFLIKKNRKAVINEEQKGVSLKTGIIRLLTDFRVLTFSLLLIIPVSICGMFLSYVFPVSASEMGMSSANIGRAFLVYGLFVVYLGPLFGKYIGNKFNTNRAVIFAGLLCAVSILVFAFGMNTATAFAAVLILGLSDSFGLAAQGSCFINFEASKRLGGGIPLSVYSLFYKAGQMLGPLVFGGLAVLGTAMGIKIVGFVTVGLLVLYVILNSKVNSNVTDKKLEI
jgi:predicted MFS family arabinose efflux permease